MLDTELLCISKRRTPKREVLCETKFQNGISGSKAHCFRQRPRTGTSFSCLVERVRHGTGVVSMAGMPCVSKFLAREDRRRGTLQLETVAGAEERGLGLLLELPCRLQLNVIGRRGHDK